MEKDINTDIFFKSVMRENCVFDDNGVWEMTIDPHRDLSISKGKLLFFYGVCPCIEGAKFSFSTLDTKICDDIPLSICATIPFKPAGEIKIRISSPLNANMVLNKIYFFFYVCNVHTIPNIPINIQKSIVVEEPKFPQSWMSGRFQEVVLKEVVYGSPPPPLKLFDNFKMGEEQEISEIKTQIYDHNYNYYGLKNRIHYEYTRGGVPLGGSDFDLGTTLIPRRVRSNKDLSIKLNISLEDQCYIRCVVKYFY